MGQVVTTLRPAVLGGAVVDQKRRDLDDALKGAGAPAGDGLARGALLSAVRSLGVGVREGALCPDGLAGEAALGPAEEGVDGGGVALGEGLVGRAAVGEGEAEAGGQEDLEVVHEVHVADAVAHAVAHGREQDAVASGAQGRELRERESEPGGVVAVPMDRRGARAEVVARGRAQDARGERGVELVAEAAQGEQRGVQGVVGGVEQVGDGVAAGGDGGDVGGAEGGEEEQEGLDGGGRGGHGAVNGRGARRGEAQPVRAESDAGRLPLWELGAAAGAEGSNLGAAGGRAEAAGAVDGQSCRIGGGGGGGARQRRIQFEARGEERPESRRWGGGNVQRAPHAGLSRRACSLAPRG